ncbi:MAG: hypothetical protein U1E38_10790 [Rhodospirillales bacterium]
MLAEIASTQESSKARAILEEALLVLEDWQDRIFHGGSVARKDIVRGFLRIGDFDRAWQVAEYDFGDNFYALAKWAAERGDLNRARNALKKAKDDGKFLIEHLADDGLTQQAAELSRDEDDIDSRIETLLYIAGKSRASGDADKFTMILGEALRLIDNYHVSGTTSNKVALALADFGNVTEARRVLDDVATRALKDKDVAVIVETAKSLATLGLTDQALELANHIGENENVSKQDIIEQVAFALARSGAGESSFRLINSMKQPYKTGKACEQLVTIFVAKAMIAQAIKASECIDNGSRSVVLVVAMRELAQANKANQALEIYSVIPESPRAVGRDDRATAAIDLVPSLARNGQLDMALNLASKQEAGTRVIALSGIVAALDSTANVQRSQLASIILNVKVVGESYETDAIWATVALNLTQAGELREALQAGRRVTDNGKRSRALAAIAVAYTEAGSIIAARRVLGEVSDPNIRMSAIVDILKARLELSATKERIDEAS